MSLEFGERHLDGVQVRAVRRQKEEPCPCIFENSLGFFAFMARQVIEDDNIARAERRRELCLYICLEDRPVHGAVDDPRGCQAIATQGGDEGLGLPVTEGDSGFEPLSAPRPAAQAGHLRRRRRFIDEHEPLGLLPHKGLSTCAPDPAILTDVGACALGRQQRFF